MTSKPMQLDILRTIYTLQNMHGLRNDDYTHYRRYLTRRLNRLYQKLNLTHGKNKYQARAITIEHVSQGDARYLLLLLLTIERAWAYGQARLSESTQNSAIRSSVTHHARCRFRKCEAHCKVVEDLVLPRAGTVPNGSLQVLDEQTRHELTAYLHDIRGRCALGQKQFGKALECFVQAHSAYAGLCPPQPGGNILNNLEGSENEAATHKEVAVTSDWTHWVTPIMQQLEEAMIYTHHQLNNQERVSTSLSAGGVSSVLSSYPITPVSALFRSERSHLGPQELCWANMPIRVTATRILTMLKDLRTQEESVQDLVTHLPFRGSSAKILSKLRKVTEAYDRVFATCDELLEVVRNGAPIVHDADEDMNLQLLRQYVTFRMLVCRIRRGRTYIQVYFQIYLAQKGFITKEEVNSITLPARNALSCVMSKSSKTITAQDMAHLFAALAEHTREVRRLPGLLEDQERQYEAIHTYARAGSLLFKGVAWALQPHNSTEGTFGCATKAYACLIHAERLAQQCIKCDVAVPHEWEDDVHILHTQIVREQALFKANEALQQVKAAATACDGIESIHVTKNESSRASKRPRIAASDLPPQQIHHNVGRLSSLEPRRELLLPKPCFYDIALSYIEEDVVPIDALEESLTQVASSGKVQKRSNDATLNSKNQKSGWFSNWFGSS